MISWIPEMMHQMRNKSQMKNRTQTKFTARHKMNHVITLWWQLTTIGAGADSSNSNWTVFTIYLAFQSVCCHQSKRLQKSHHQNSGRFYSIFFCLILAFFLLFFVFVSRNSIFTDKQHPLISNPEAIPIAIHNGWLLQDTRCY